MARIRGFRTRETAGGEFRCNAANGDQRVETILGFRTISLICHTFPPCETLHSLTNRRLMATGGSGGALAPAEPKVNPGSRFREPSIGEGRSK